MTPTNIRIWLAQLTPRAGLRLRAIPAALVAAASGWLMPATTAFAFEVCERTCAPADTACLSAVAACETRIHAYNLYMEQMGAGIERHSLPAVYRSVLRSRYPRANLDAYRFAFSDRQPAGNATTDCSTTYYNSRDYVDRLRSAEANPNWPWLLHEITHVEQCASGGGREAYARRWWTELEAALAAQGRRVDFAQTPQQLANQMGALFAQVHDALPMERAASTRADIVRAELSRCCIDREGRPMLPLKAISIDDRLDAGNSRRHILVARIEGGDSPLTARWRIRNPGEASYTDQPAQGLELLWMPQQDAARAERVEGPIDTRLVWRYDVEVEITQDSPSLDRTRLARRIVLSERILIKKPVTGVPTPAMPSPPPPSLPGPTVPGATRPPLPGPTMPAPTEPPRPMPGPGPSRTPTTL